MARNFLTILGRQFFVWFSAGSGLFVALVVVCGSARAALLAYEPFTNSIGTAIIGSGGGSGFNGVWQSNSSQGTATNTGYGLSFTDGAGHTLATAGGAGFFQGLTTANNNMQPIRLFNFSRGTNGTDGVTTWISFLVARQGPAGTLSGNAYGRGANVDHDLNAGTLQKLAVGNSSGVGSNTVALIPQGSATYCRGDPGSRFGAATNFVVVRIDHLSGGNDSAWLFVNPTLGAEPATNSAGAFWLAAFDFSFDRLRVFAGGQGSADQPYAQMVLDEYRLGETYADVTPVVVGIVPQALVITNAQMVAGGIVLRGTGGTNGVPYHLLGNADLLMPSSNWPILATNSFDANGGFALTNPLKAGTGAQFYRLRIPPAAMVGPFIVSGPVSLTVTQGQPAAFSVTANGSSPLNYQWLFKTNNSLSGQTSSSLTIANAQPTNEGAYSVRISNGGGSVTSTQAVLTVLSPPSITTQPLSQSVVASNPVTFNVTAMGSATLRYQWYFNTNTLITTATNPSYAISSIASNNVGAYSVTVANNYGAVTSSFALLNLTDNLIANGDCFVSPAGSDSNPGTLTSPFLTISKGLATIGNGGKLYLRAGVYALPGKLSLSKTASPTNIIRLWAFPGETPIIDSTGNSSDGISVSGNWYHLKGLTVMKAGHNGINISGNSNIVEFCTVHDNGNTGLHITGGTGGTTFPAYNLILNCDSYLNYDPPIGGNADGFTAKWNLGPGNVFSGCRAWWNSDDGWDFWMGDSPVIITNCWAFHNGTNYWNDPQFNGNGNGFKLGGNYVGAPHRLVHSVAFGNEANGVDQNNNISGQTLDNNTAWANKGRNFAMAHGANTTPHIVRNNLSFAAASSDSFTSGTLNTNNSWQVISSPSANASDVQSVDESVAMQPRNADGSLPTGTFLRPVPGGRLIDKGINIGEPYSGAAPDLGAFGVAP